MDFKPISLGFTGSQHGWMSAQGVTFFNLIDAIDMLDFHHGMCIGCDFYAHEMVRARRREVNLIGHPPADQTKMAKCTGFFEVKPPKPYIERNHDIVDASDLVIAIPKYGFEVRRSGTWATIRYCEKTNTRCIIIMPKGNIHIL